MTTKEAIRLTNLQFGILGAVRYSWRAGDFIREQMRIARVPVEGPAFYQLMARLEKAQLLEGKYTTRMLGKQIVRKRSYHCTLKGIQAYNSLRAFHDAVAFMDP